MIRPHYTAAQNRKYQKTWKILIMETFPCNLSGNFFTASWSLKVLIAIIIANLHEEK